MAALAAGYDTTASGMTLDRFCGGGITSVNLATAAVMSGMEDCVIAGGTEMMSFTAAYGAEQANAGIKLLGMGSGNPELDALHPQSHQGVCGDAIAAKEGIPREVLDALARRPASSAPTGQSAKAVSPSRWSRSTTKTAAWRSITRNFPAPKPLPKGWRAFVPASMPSPISTSVKAAPSASRSSAAIRT